MWNRPFRPASWMALAMSLFACLSVSPAHAVPGYGSNNTTPPATAYATVTPTLLSSTAATSTKPATYTYGFAVSVPTTTGAGLKGLLVGVGSTGGSASPVGISTPANCNAKSGNPAWWDYKGGADANGNGIPDPMMEPGENFAATVHTLTFNRTIPADAWQITLHVIQPGGKTFFSDLPKLGSVKGQASVDGGDLCTTPGKTLSLPFTISNTGTLALSNLVIGVPTSNTGATQLTAGAPGATSLAVGASTTVLVQVKLPSVSGTVTLPISAKDSYGNTITASGIGDVTVVNPSISATGPTSVFVVSGGSKVLTYTLTNTGDVTLRNITVSASATGGSATAGTPASTTLTPGQSTTVTVNYTGASADGSVTLMVSAGESCSGTSVSSTVRTDMDVIRPALQVTGTDYCLTPGSTGMAVFTILNTGDVAISNLSLSATSTTGATQVTAGTPGSSSLGAGASTTVTVTLIAPTTTGTVTLYVSGTDDVALSTVSASGSSQAKVISPDLALTLNALVGPFVPGQAFNVTGTYSNTGNTALSNVTLVLTGLPGLGTQTLQIGNLAVNDDNVPFSAQFTLPSNFTPGRQFSINAIITGKACQQTAQADAQTVGRSDAPPTFTISGRAICGPAPTFTDPTLVNFTDTPGYALEGVLVQLLGTGQPTPPSTLTNAAGEFSFSVPAGTYQVRLTALEREITDTVTFVVGPDKALGDIPVSPLKVCYTAVQATSGRMYFSTTWSGLPAVGAPVLTAADLTNTAYTCPPTGPFKYFQYTGEIPGFPELGTFDLNTKKIWLVMYSPLAAEDRWVGTSFTNLVGVRGVVVPGVAGSGSTTSYVIRTTLNQPFECAGTAFNYTVTSATISPAPAVAAKVTQLPSVRTDGTAGTQPAAGTVPQGWMARTQLEWIWPSGVSGQFWANGSYTNVCGDVYQFSICPVEKAPAAKKR